MVKKIYIQGGLSPNYISDIRVRGRAGWSIPELRFWYRVLALAALALAFLLLASSPLEAQQLPEVEIKAGHTLAMQGAAMPALIDLGDIDPHHARWTVRVWRIEGDSSSRASDCETALMGSEQSDAPPLPPGATSTYDGLPEVYASSDCPAGEYMFSLQAYDARDRVYVSDRSDPWTIEGRPGPRVLGQQSPAACYSGTLTTHSAPMSGWVGFWSGQGGSVAPTSCTVSGSTRTIVNLMRSQSSGVLRLGLATSDHPTTRPVATDFPDTLTTSRTVSGTPYTVTWSSPGTMVAAGLGNYRDYTADSVSNASTIFNASAVIAVSWSSPQPPAPQSDVDVTITPDTSSANEGVQVNLTATGSGGESSELYMSAGIGSSAKLYRVDPDDLSSQSAYVDLGAFKRQSGSNFSLPISGIAHDGTNPWYVQKWRILSNESRSYIHKLAAVSTPGTSSLVGYLWGRQDANGSFIEGLTATSDTLVGVGSVRSSPSPSAPFVTGIYSISKTGTFEGRNRNTLLQTLPAGLAQPLSTTWATDRLLTLDGSGDELWQTLTLTAATSTTLVGALPAGITDPTGAAWHNDQLLVADSTGDELWRVNTTSPGGSGTTLLGNLLRTGPAGLMSVLTSPVYTFAWTATGGTLSSSSGSAVTWTAPADVSGDQTYVITVTVTASTGGTAMATRSITVRDDDIAPGVPTGMTATPSGDNGLSVQVESPTTGGAPASYEVRYRVCCSGTWQYIERSFPTFTITGLERGTEYELQARAENVHGASPYTSPSTMATTRATRPDRPDPPTVTPASETRLTVSWTAPFNRGAAISSYDLQHRRSGAQEWVPTSDLAGTSHVLTGLSVGTTYEVQVRATNSEGDSDWSATGQGTTEYPALDAISIAGSSWLTDRPGLALVDRSGGSGADAGFRWRLMPDPDAILLDNSDVETRWLIEAHAEGGSSTSVTTQVVTAANQLFSCGGVNFVLITDRNACPTNSAEVLAAVRLVWTAQVHNPITMQTWQSPYSVTWLSEPREPDIGGEDIWTHVAPEVQARYADGKLTLTVNHPAGPSTTQVLINNEIPIVRFDVPMATGTVATTTEFDHTPPSHSVRYYLTPAQRDRSWISYRVRGAVYASSALEIAVEGRDTRSEIPSGSWGYTQWTREVDLPLEQGATLATGAQALKTPLPADPRFLAAAANILALGRQASGDVNARTEDIPDEEANRVLVLGTLIVAVGGGVAIFLVTKVSSGLTFEGVAAGTMFAAGTWAGVGLTAAGLQPALALGPLIIPIMAIALVVVQRTR